MVLVLVKICNQDNHNVNSVCTVIARNLAKKKHTEHGPTSNSHR